MRLFLAREALDPHLIVAAGALDSRLSLLQRAKAGFKAGVFYSGWYVRQWLPFNTSGAGRFHPRLRRHLRLTGRLSRKLARTVFHALIRYGPTLERRQLLLGRFVDMGTELFAMAATCSRAQALLDRGNAPGELFALVDYFCRASSLRVRQLFRDVRSNADNNSYSVAQKVLAGDCDWLQDGIVQEPRERVAAETKLQAG